MATMKPMKPAEIDKQLVKLAGWKVVRGKLEKTYKFPDFKSALARVNQVGELAESAEHHPDLLLGWGKMRVQLTTHDAGGITVKDLELARQIEALEV